MKIIKKFTTNEANSTYKPKDKVEITFPNNVLDLHSFVLYYDIFCDYYELRNNGKYTYYNAPKLSSSIIQTLRVKIDNVVVQEIDEYGLIYNILHNYKNEDNELEGDSSENYHFLNNNGYLEGKTYDKNNVDSPVTFKKFIKNFLGFLNEGDRYFDARKQTLSLEIVFYPSSCLYTTFYSGSTSVVNTTKSPDFTISNVYGTICIVDNVSYELNENFSFKDYRHRNGLICQNSKTSQTMIKTKNKLLWMLGTFSPTNRETIQNLQLQHVNENTTNFGEKISDSTTTTSFINAKNYTYKQALDSKKPNVLNNSIFYKRDGRGIKSCQFSVNGYDITPPMSVPECYNETRRTLNTDLKRIKTIQSFEADFFSNLVDYEDNDDGYKQIDWKVVSDETIQYGGIPHIFICFKNKI